MSDTRLRPRGDRTPIARHGRLSTPNPAAGIVKFLAVAVCVVLVSAVSVVAIAFGRVSAGIHTVDIGDGAVPSIGAYSGAVNLLLVGSDTRTGQKGHYGTDPGSTLNDVNILLHVSEDHSKATVISFPRDLYVDVPACKNPTTPGAMVPAQTGVKINSVLHTGGVACVRNTVAKLTGLDIPYVAMITFDGVVQMSNAVGGVPVCVAAPINDDYTELHLTKGIHTLKGPEALKFLRTRHGVGDGSDLTRISSQQVFLSSLVRKLKSSSTLTDVTKIYGIASAAAHSMTLSTSLGLDTIASIAKAVAPIDLNKVVFVQYPTRLQGDGVVPNTTAATVLMTAVQQDRTLKLSKPNAADAKGSVVEGSDSSSSSSSAPTPKPTATKKTGSSSEVTLPSGVLGQTAAQKSCSVGNANLGKR